MSLTSLLSWIIDPNAPRNGAVNEAIEERRKASHRKARAACQLSDTIADFVHGFKGDQQREIARRGE